MKISTRGRYGLRAMFELARGFGEGPLRMSTIAERQDLSRKHLHALLTSLKAAGLVCSVRGPGGGFILTRPPDRIRLSEILRALEGPLAVVHCVPNGRACGQISRCAVRNVWQKLSGAIEEVLDGVILEDLVGRQAKACSKPGEGRRKHRSRGRGGPTVKRSGPASRRPGPKAGQR